MADLISVAAELYAMPAGDFTAARNDRAKQLRAAGEAALAGEVKALPKPSAAAWVVNLMVRHMDGPVGELLELGATLRQAQEDLDATTLRTLHKQRRALVAAVVRAGRALAAEHGQKVSAGVAEQVEATLHAAMTDARAAAALRTGLLVEPMAASGLGPADLDGVLAVPVALDDGGPPGSSARPATGRKGTTTAGRQEPSDEQRRAAHAAALALAREELDAAEERAGRAMASSDAAETQLRQLQANELRLRSELEELRRRVDEVEHELSRNERTLTRAEKERAAVRRKAEDATARADVARAELDRLQRSGPGSRPR